MILASQSPRRRELMGLFGKPFTVKSADIDETMGRDAARETARLSLQKAQAVEREEDDVVVGADTVVVCDGAVLGKPHSREEAVRMLEMLSGREHQVMTGLSVVRGDKSISCTEITKVFFRSLSREEIRRYVDSGEPMDKAGAYGIQGHAALFVEKIEGDYYNVVGLPVCRLGVLLRQIAPEWMEEDG